MPPTRARSCLLLAGLLLAACPAAAEIYRWRDADGREHFTSDLHRVPPAYRRQARENGTASTGRVQFHSGEARHDSQPDEAAPPARAEAPEKRETPEKPPAPRFDCSALQKQARKKLDEVAKRERAVERREDAASDIASSLRADKHRQDALAEAKERLAEAQERYERWRRIHYTRGAPPGCLR